MGHNAIDAEIAACDALSLQATRSAAQAFERLLKFAEERDCGQTPRIARFLAATPAVMTLSGCPCGTPAPLADPPERGPGTIMAFWTIWMPARTSVYGDRHARSVR